MKDIKLDSHKIKKYTKMREQGESLQIVMIINQKISLWHRVIHYWQIEEEIEGICTLDFDFKDAERCHNMTCGYSCYQIQRNADGRAVLVRISEKRKNSGM